MSMDHWCSPPEMADGLEDLFGGPVDCDPCSNARSIIRAVTAYTAGGTFLPWGRRTYKNPPYSRLDLWTDVGIREIRAGRVHELVNLEPVAPSTRWWRKAMGEEPIEIDGDTIWAPKPVVMFTKRINFINEHGVVIKGARHDSVITYYGPRRQAFRRAFKHLERWVVG